MTSHRKKLFSPQAFYFILLATILGIVIHDPTRGRAVFPKPKILPFLKPDIAHHESVNIFLLLTPFVLAGVIAALCIRDNPQSILYRLPASKIPHLRRPLSIKGELYGVSHIYAFLQGIIGGICLFSVVAYASWLFYALRSGAQHLSSQSEVILSTSYMALAPYLLSPYLLVAVSMATLGCFLRNGFCQFSLRRSGVDNNSFIHAQQSNIPIPPPVPMIWGERE